MRASHPLSRRLHDIAHTRFSRFRDSDPARTPPGVQIGVAVAGRPLLACAFGEFDTLTSRPLLPHSIFKCASMSKPISAAVAMKLAARGQIHLDRPVLDILPWQPSPEQCAGFDAKRITPRMLLCHSAGWNIRGFPMIPISERGPSALDILSGCFGPDLTPTLLFQPGTSMSYAGGNYVMLQALIEHATQTPYATLVDELLVQPCGLTSVWAGWKEGQAPLTVRGHSDGVPLEHTWYPALCSSGIFAAAIDLARLWSRIACTDPRAALLSPESVRDMTRVHASQKNIQFGLGFVIVQWGDLTVCKHHGWCQGFFNLTEGFRDLSVATTVQTNGDGDVARLVADTIAAEIMAEINDSRAEVNRIRRAG